MLYYSITHVLFDGTSPGEINAQLEQRGRPLLTAAQVEIIIMIIIIVIIVTIISSIIIIVSSSSISITLLVVLILVS